MSSRRFPFDVLAVDLEAKLSPPQHRLKVPTPPPPLLVVTEQLESTGTDGCHGDAKKMDGSLSASPHTSAPLDSPPTIEEMTRITISQSSLVRGGELEHGLDGEPEEDSEDGETLVLSNAMTTSMAELSVTSESTMPPLSSNSCPVADHATMRAQGDGMVEAAGRDAEQEECCSCSDVSTDISDFLTDEEDDNEEELPVMQVLPARLSSAYAAEQRPSRQQQGEYRPASSDQPVSASRQDAPTLAERPASFHGNSSRHGSQKDRFSGAWTHSARSSCSNKSLLALAKSTGSLKPAGTTRGSVPNDEAREEQCSSDTRNLSAAENRYLASDRLEDGSTAASASASGSSTGTVSTTSTIAANETLLRDQNHAKKRTSAQPLSLRLTQAPHTNFTQSSPNIAIAGSETRVELKSASSITAPLSPAPISILRSFSNFFHSPLTSDPPPHSASSSTCYSGRGSMTMVESRSSHAASTSAGHSNRISAESSKASSFLNMRRGNKTYTVYKIAIKSSGKHWLLHKRYSEFDALDKKIREQFPCIHMNLPEFPPKRMFFANMDPDFVEKRATALNAYIQEIFQCPTLLRAPFVYAFLCGEGSSGGGIVVASGSPVPLKTVDDARDSSDEEEDEAGSMVRKSPSSSCTVSGVYGENDTESPSTIVFRVDKSKKITGHRGPCNDGNAVKLTATFSTSSMDGSLKSMPTDRSSLVARAEQFTRRLKRVAFRSTLLDDVKSFFDRGEPSPPPSPLLETEENGSCMGVACTEEKKQSDMTLEERCQAAAQEESAVSSNEDKTGKLISTVSIDDFYLLKLVGKGNFGKVMLAQHKEDHKVYAIKVISKATVKRKSKNSASTGIPSDGVLCSIVHLPLCLEGYIDRIMTERNVLIRSLKHPFLIGLRSAFQTKEKLYFVTDYVNGGELFFHLQRERRFSELRSRFYAAEILSALAYLHVEVDVVYRDLKPENILLDASGHIKLTDFGLAKENFYHRNRGRTRTFCGTPEYLAPEVLRKEPYGFPVDWWCLGAILYEMLVGLPPFYSQDNNEMYNKILNEKLRFPPYVSSRARSIICGLLHRVPNFRLGTGPCNTSSPESVRNHPFFEGIDWDRLYHRQYRPPFVPNVTHIFDVSNIDPQFVNEPIEVEVTASATESTSAANVADVGVEEEDPVSQTFKGFTYVGGDTKDGWLEEKEGI